MNYYKLYGSLLRHFMLRLYTVSGEFEDNEMRVLVADDGSTLDYITKQIFPNGASISRKKYITVLDAPKLSDSRADLVVVGVNRLLADRYFRQGFNIIPKWVKLSLPVVEDPYARLSAFGRPTRSYFNRKLHKIAESRFECEVVTRRGWLYRFYHDMYRPYVLQRFNDDAVVYPPKVLQKFYKRGFLIIAKKNGEPVAGQIVYKDGGELHTPFMGVLGGDIDLVKDGAMFALHYYLAEKAYEWGSTSINFGLSRPFLSDGTLQYKLQWHMDIIPFDKVTSVFAVATPNTTPQARKFFEANPCFYITGGKCRRSDE